MSLEVNTLEVAELLPQRGSESQQTVTGGSQVEVSLGIDPGVKWVHLSGMRVKKQSPNSPLTLIGRAVCVWVSCSRKKNNLLRTFFLGCDETADVTEENFTHCVFMQISADYVHKHTHEHTHTHTHRRLKWVSWSQGILMSGLIKVWKQTLKGKQNNTRMFLMRPFRRENIRS